MDSTYNYPATQAALEAYNEASNDFYNELSPEQMQLLKTIVALVAMKAHVKDVGKIEGVGKGTTLRTFDETMVLSCSSTPAARISKEGLIALGPIGEAAVGAWEKAHENDEGGTVLKIQDKASREIELEIIAKWVEEREKCIALYEAQTAQQEASQ